MTDIIVLNSEVTDRVVALTDEAQAGLYAVGASLLKNEEDWVAVIAGMLDLSMQAAANADMDAANAALVTRRALLQDINTQVVNSPATFSVAYPIKVAGDDPRCINSTNMSIPKAMNYRDENAGISYRAEINASADAGGGSISLFSFDEATGIDTLLWTSAGLNNTTGFNTNYSFIVVPLKPAAGGATQPCIVAIPTQTATTYKVWSWNGSAMATYTSTSGNTQGTVAYDTTNNCVYFSTNGTTNLRVLFADAETTSPTNAQCPRGVAFVSWNADIWAADMKTRMVDYTRGAFNNNFWRARRLAWTAAAHGYQVGVGQENDQYLGINSSGQHNNGSTGNYFQYWMYGNLNLTMFGGTTWTVDQGHAPYSLEPTGVQPMLIKTASGWATETFSYQIETDFRLAQYASGAGHSYHFWPVRMWWAINRWNLTNEIPVCKAKGVIDLVHWTPSSSSALTAFIPKWWSTAKRKIGFHTSARNISSWGNMTAHEMYIY